MKPKPDKNKIIHRFFSEEATEHYYMVIIFMEYKRVVSTFAISFPSWFSFSDAKFKHYPFCNN